MKRWIALLLVLCLYPFFGLCEEEDYVFAQPGDSGADVRLMLEKARDLGFLKDLPDETEEYLPEYETGIREMEKALDLTEDGIIRLSEFTEIETAVTKGNRGSLVQDLLERLFDLGYITKVLPEPHDVYEANYEAAVKKAEKALGLKADGIITGSEWEVLKAQRPKTPDKVKNLRGSGRNQKVTLSWSPVRGAAYYRIYRDGILLAQISAGKAQYVDGNVSMGDYHSYHIIACKYKLVSSPSDTVGVEVPIVYTTANFKQMKENSELIYVKFGTSKWNSARVKGSDYYITASQTIGGRTYTATLIMEDYRNWTGKLITSYPNIKTCSGWGYLEVKNGSITIYLHHIYYNW